MRAILVTKRGDCRADASVLQLTDAAQAPPFDAAKSAGLLLRVLACGWTPGDLKMMKGAMLKSSGAYVPGIQVCGVVEAVGAKARGAFQVGDRVIAVLRPLSLTATHGGMAERVVVEAALAAKIPASFRAAEAAALPFAGVMAAQTIKDMALKPGARVLVLGASTLAGSLVVQLVRSVSGASFVAGTTPKAELVASLGLDQVIVDDNQHDKWWDVLRGQEMDAIVDCLGEASEQWRRADYVLKPSSASVLATLVGEISRDGDQQQASQLLTLGVVNLWKSLWRMGGKTPKLVTIGAFPSTALLENAIQLVAEQKMRVELDPNAPFAFKTEALVHAVTLQRSHQVSGALAFIVRDEETSS
ncbi:hypothetical protein PINS_up006595 [Pythium insidiosum]|nr:hypothetical protein PINS_up006595 [Pythium insidiosum]